MGYLGKRWRIVLITKHKEFFMLHQKQIAIVLAVALGGVLMYNMTRSVTTLGPMEESLYLSVGEDFVIELPENPTTGHLWQVLDAMNTDNVEFLEDQYIADKAPAGVAGSGGVHQFFFRAVDPGNTKIAMGLFGPGQQDEPVEMKIYDISIAPAEMAVLK